MDKKDILFKKGVKIQGLNRIALPKELLENMNLKEGDHISIYYNPKEEKISIKKNETK